MCPEPRAFEKWVGVMREFVDPVNAAEDRLEPVSDALIARSARPC
ncbi:hypothetical protein COMA2_10429 [Candidatus Nitrospira nitrificans]|uniref:Uncharacterized protein n=1 Tax=Candidatus Nitrospira nitrificans TaxID=1742973 RepID=A0A0S4L5P8_9BACT|nr:hypothetical protein COMA2_10429 [Candidatus Nitrospira nitrificans]